MQERRIGVILSYVYNIIHIAVNIIYVPLLLKYIGQSEYGLYQVVGSVISYFSVMESSLSAGVLKFYCEYKAKNDDEGMENTLAISKYVYNIASLIVAAVGIFGLGFVYFFYKSSFTRSELIESELMLSLLIVNLIVSLKNYIYVAVISGNEKYAFSKTLSIISQLIQPLAVVLIIRRIPYAVVIVIVQLIINIVVAFIRKTYSKRVLKAKVVLHEKNKKFIKTLIGFSSQILLAVIADQIFWKTDQVLIGRIYGTTLVAVYAVGAQIYLNYSPIGVAVAGVFMPQVSRIYLLENRNEVVSALFVKVGRIAAYILLLVLTGYVLLGKEFIFIWVGESYEISYYIALVVMIPFSIDLMQHLALTILQVYNKYFFRGVMYFVVALMNIGLTIILLQKLGIVGAAIATGISMFIGNGIIMNIYYSKIGINIKLFWKEILPIIVSALICMIISYPITRIDVQSLLGNFLIHGVCYVILYSAVMFVFVFNEYERDLVHEIVKKFKSK